MSLPVFSEQHEISNKTLKNNDENVYLDPKSSHMNSIQANLSPDALLTDPKQKSTTISISKGILVEKEQKTPQLLTHVKTNRCVKRIIVPGTQPANREKNNIDSQHLHAEFPELPSLSTVLSLMNQIEDEIKTEKRRLSSLESEKRLGFKKLIFPECIEPLFQLQDYHSSFIYHNSIKPIIANNNRISEKTHHAHTLPRGDIYHSCSHFSTVKKCESHISILEPLFKTVFQQKRSLKVYQQNITNEYIMRYRLWSRLSSSIIDYHTTACDSITEWPPEFAKSLRKNNNLSELSLVASDQPMYLTDHDRECYLYYDENNLISDPVKEYELYKKRSSWTEKESRIFIEKYAIYPRDFKKISSYIAGKTTKDIVEYYNINRKRLGLNTYDKINRAKIVKFIEKKKSKMIF